MKYVPPSIQETAFNCPHCGALATQFWNHLSAKELSHDEPLPNIVNEEHAKLANFDAIEDDKERVRIQELYKRVAKGDPFISDRYESQYSVNTLYNVHVSRCFNCNAVSLWLYDQLLYPQRGEAPAPNPDLPEDIQRDYNEASKILDHSPRGAAALIRLAIQKLCKTLGQSGENINNDIAALVAMGLDVRIQKALDFVRVVGNHAVHPGQIDLRDDRSTAESLFRLTNLIAERMISEAKHIDEFYSTLPEETRKAIEKRDARANPDPSPISFGGGGFCDICE